MGIRAPIRPLEILSRLEEPPFRGKMRNAFRGGEGRAGASYSFLVRQGFHSGKSSFGGRKKKGASYISDPLLSRRAAVKGRFVKNKAGKVSNLTTRIVREEVAEFGKKPDFFGSGIGRPG